MNQYQGNDAKSYFGQHRPELLPLIPLDTGRFLDLGCGAGSLGEAIKRRQAAHVGGIELNLGAALRAQTLLDFCVCAELEAGPIFGPHQFDLLIFADVLEHLEDPWLTLQKWLTVLKPGGCVVISLPNVQHFLVSFALVFRGSWEYRERGILDRTHLRFFTRKTMRKLIKDSGLVIEKEVPNLQPRGFRFRLIEKCSFGVLRGFLAQQWMYLARWNGSGDSSVHDITGQPES